MKYITLKIVGGSKVGQSSMGRPKTFDDVQTRLAAIRLGCDLLSSMRVYASRGIEKAFAQGANPPRAFSRWVKEAEEIERVARRLLKSDLKGALSIERMHEKVVDLLKKSPLKLSLINDGPTGLIAITITADSILHLVKLCGYVEKSFSIHVTNFGWKAASEVELVTPVTTTEEDMISMKFPLKNKDYGSEVKSSNEKTETWSRSELKSAAVEETSKGESYIGQTDPKPAILELRDDNTDSLTASEVDFAKSVTIEGPTTEVDMIPKVMSRASNEETGTRSHPGPISEDILGPKEESGETGLKSPIPEMLADNIPIETDMGSQIKPEVSSDSKVLILTIVEAGWDGSGDLQLETSYGDHSAKMHNSLRDPKCVDLLLDPQQEHFFPKTVKHHHVHKLTLRYTFPEECIQIYCDLCEDRDGELDHNMSCYYCEKCDYIAHTHCCINQPIEGALLYKRHEHLAKMHYSMKAPCEDLLLGPEREDFLLHQVGGMLRRNPLHEKWGQLNVLLLMAKELPSLPEKPHCPNLGFLFLQNNRGLRAVSDTFFENMPSLQVLDLSRSGIRSLPTSVFGLTKLQALFLRDCHNLDQISPRIGNLKQIELLDLWGTKVYNLPDEIASLGRLQCLLVSFYEADEVSEYVDLPPNLISYGVLSKLRMLKTLSISIHPVDSRWKNNSKEVIVDVSKLNELAYLQYYFPEHESLELFVKSYPWGKKVLEKFKFVVGRDIERVVSRVPTTIESEYDKFERCLRFVNSYKIPEALGGVLLRATAFYVDHLYTIESLSKFGNTNFKELKFLVVRECPILNVVIECDEESDSIFPCLEHLSFHYLWKVECIWKGPVSGDSFNKLKRISVYMCPKLEYIFTSSMLHCAVYLEELIVEDCKSMKIIVKTEGERVAKKGILPNLRTVTLNLLPRLLTFWDGVLPNQVQFNIRDCPNLTTRAKDASNVNDGNIDIFLKQGGEIA